MAEKNGNKFIGVMITAIIPLLITGIIASAKYTSGIAKEVDVIEEKMKHLDKEVGRKADNARTEDMFSAIKAAIGDLKQDFKDSNLEIREDIKDLMKEKMK